MNKKDDFQKQIASLAANAASDSVGSIDFGINAKAVALANADLQKKLVSILQQGARLVGVRANPGYGANAVEYQVRFLFKSGASDSAVDVAEQTVVATVNIPGRSVRVGDVEQSSSGFDAPFAVVAPLRDPMGGGLLGGPGLPGGPGQPGDPADPINNFLNRTRLGDLIAILKQRQPGLAADDNTWWDSAYDTAAPDKNTSEDSYVQTTTLDNDRQTDTILDFHKDPDSTLDYKVDGKNDPENGILIEARLG